MRSLANACRIARLREPWSARALAAAYAVPPPISVAALIDHVMGYSSFEKIKRVFVLVLENRSFDHMLGFSQIHGVDAVTGKETEIWGLSDIHAASGGLEAKECNRDSSGTCWHAAAPTEFALQIDPRHEYENMAQQLGIAGGQFPDNEGFVLSMEQKIADAIKDDPDSPDAKASPGVVMRCFLPEQISMLDHLAREYAVCDQWFCSGPLATWPNRMFIHAASSGGLDHSPSGFDIVKHLAPGAGYEFEHGTIFDRLDHAGIDWQIYGGDEFPVSWAFAHVNVGDITDMEDFYSELFDEDFSYRYVFIEPDYDVLRHYAHGDSEHPFGNIKLGEMLIAKIYWFLRHSPYWEESAFVILYDEGGGFYDHQPPPFADAPGDKQYEGRNKNGFDFTLLGPRVPAVVVSPWIPRGTIDHTQYDHTSLLKTVERRFALDPLTDRDAKANDFAHLFRLQTPRDTHQPASGMTAAEGESATPGETSSPLMIARGDLDETVRLIDAAVAAERRAAPARPTVPPSTRIAELPPSTIGFLEVAFIKESKIRPAAERPAVAERVRQVRTVGEALDLLDRLKAERGAGRRDARDMAPAVRIPRRRDRPEVGPPTTPRRTPHR
jgi:phospholipase C